METYISLFYVFVYMFAPATDSGTRLPQMLPMMHPTKRTATITQVGHPVPCNLHQALPRCSFPPAEKWKDD